MLDTLRSIGVTNLIEMRIPQSQTSVSALNVESFVYFEEMLRAGMLTGSRMGGNATRPTARLVPAVEYLQQQRLRMMMMTELAAATKGIDVYLVASNNGGAAGGAARGRGGEPGSGSDSTAAGRAAVTATQPGVRAGDPAVGRSTIDGGGRGAPGGGNPGQRHSTMANLACYPAMNVPNGFSAAGIPTNATFFARPFGEMELIALVKAYQDRAKHHLRKPLRLDV
jgi:hypothetical protein